MKRYDFVDWQEGFYWPYWKVIFAHFYDELVNEFDSSCSDAIDIYCQLDLALKFLFHLLAYQFY